MNRDNDRQTSIILAVLGILPIVWLGLLIAPSVKGGLPEILPSLMNVMSDPFHIVLCEDSVKTVLVLLLCYGMGIGIYTASGSKLSIRPSNDTSAGCTGFTCSNFHAVRGCGSRRNGELVSADAE